MYVVYKRRTSKQVSTRDPPQYRLKVKGWKKIFHANRDQKKADKIDFKTKAVKRDKERYYIMIKGSI